MKRNTRLVALAALTAAVLVPVLSGHAPAELKTTELGKGPTVVLVHAIGSTRMGWMPVARKLIGEHRVVMVDLPGHGESPLPDPFSLETCGAELLAALAKEDPKQTVLVGIGVGGLVSLHALDKKPDAARGVVLIETAMKSPMPIPDQQQQRFMQQMDARYADILNMMFTSMARDSTQGVKLRGEAARVEPRTIKSYMRVLLKADGTVPLKKVKVPVLLVASDKRWPEGKPWADVSGELGYSKADTYPVERVKDSGYMVHLDQPDSLAAVIAAFTAKTLAAK